MTPYSKNEKPPIVLSPQFQSALLIAIFLIGVNLIWRVNDFENNIENKLYNHEYRLGNLEERQKTTDTRIELLVGNNYSFRQQTK